MDPGTIVLMVYLAGVLGFLVPTARWFLNSMGDPIETEDYVGAAVMSLCCVWLWPFYLPGWWIVMLLKNSDKK